MSQTTAPAADVAAHLADMAALGFTPLEQMDPTSARNQYTRVMRARRGPDHVPVQVGDITEDVAEHGGVRVPVRIYRPVVAGPVPTVVFLHGGGWVIGDLDSHDDVTRTMCAEVGAVVVAVDYRLAPEHPYPAAVDDGWAALCWAADAIEGLGGDPARLAVAGDSAGGALATVLARRAAERGGPDLTAQLLLYPVIDLTMSSDSYRRNATGWGLTADAMAWFLGHYRGPGDDPDASPAAGHYPSHTAPVVLSTAELDPLVDEGASHADALRAAEVAVTHLRHAGQVHGYAQIPSLPSARDAYLRDLRAFAAHLST